MSSTITSRTRNSIFSQVKPQALATLSANRNSLPPSREEYRYAINEEEQNENRRVLEDLKRNLQQKKLEEL